MSHSDHGNSNSQRPGANRSRKRQDNRRGGGPPRRGGRRNQHGKGRGGHQRKHGGNAPRKPAAPSLEYVLIQEDTSLSAEISAHPGPLRWRMIPDVALLSPGLYLRYRGSLQLVTRKLEVPNAVLYAVWNDENLSYRFPDGWASPGLRAAFLMPTPFSDEEGPPWIPIDASVPDTIDAWDTGLLSSQLDPVHCARFHADLSVDSYDLQVRATSVQEDGDVDADLALQQTMEWLARNPESDHPAAVTARVMLLEQGHGLQRAGVAAMRQSEEQTAALLDDVLTVLAPDVAPVLQAVQRLWLAEDDEQTEHFIALAQALAPHVANDESPLQKPSNLAVLTTWLTGIFGSRPDRERRRPARSLFAAFRLLRRTRGNIEAFDHPDFDLPTFPTSRALSDEITRELSYFPPRETDLERLIRAMAVGESTRDFGRIHLDHLRPFSLSYRRVRGYPIAARTLLGRYDGIVTMWSFRGRELDRQGIPARALNANFVFETSTWASIRAYGRVLGAQTAISPVLSEAVGTRPERGASHHPDVARLAELSDLSLEDVSERLGRATRARRPNQQRVSDAIAAHEFLVARLVRDQEALADWTPIEPEWGDAEDTAVRRHFMYWRTYCRSYLPSATETYAKFVERVVPELAALPWKIENEALALLRTWSRQVESERVAPYEDALYARLEAILAESEHAARDERVLNLLSVLASCSFEAWSKGVELLLDHAAWDQAEWNRILDGVRDAAVRDALRASDLFRRLATVFSDENIDSVGVAAGRVEWLRQLLVRGRQSQNIRWLLQRDAWPEVVYAPAFEQWFRDHAHAAIDDPDAAVEQLLQVAATHMSAESIDIPMIHLAQYAPQNQAQHLAVLQENKRGLALSAWLSNRPALDEASVNAALTLVVEEAQSIADLRVLATLVHAAESQGIQVDSVQRDALATRVQEHEVPRHDDLAFDRHLEAWRLLDLPLDTEAAAALGARVARALPHAKGFSGAHAFAYWAVDRALTRAMGDDLLAAMGEASTLPLFEGALEDFEWPEAVLRMLRVAARSKRNSRGFRSLWGALRHADQSYVLEALIDAWIARRANLDASATLQELKAFAEAYEAILTQYTADAAPEADDGDASADDEHVEETRGDDDAQEEEETEASDEEKTAAERLADDLKQYVLRRALERIQDAIGFWTEQIEHDPAPIPDTLARAFASPQRIQLGLRDGVFPRVLDHAQRAGLEVHDGRNVVANPLIPFGINVSPVALDVALAAALNVFEGEEDAKRVKLTRDGLSISWTAPKTDEDQQTATAENAPADATAETATAENASADAIAETATEEEAPAADASPEAGNTDETATAPANEDATPAEDAQKREDSARVAAWNAKDGAATSREIAAIQRILERDPVLHFRVRQNKDGEEVQLRWRSPNRRRGSAKKR